MEGCLTVLQKSEGDDVILLIIHNVFSGTSVTRLTRALTTSSISFGHITLALDSDHRKHFWPIPSRGFRFDKGTRECFHNGNRSCCCAREEWLSKLPNTVTSFMLQLEAAPKHTWSMRRQFFSATKTWQVAAEDGTKFELAAARPSPE
jgi:hypothetical protein